TLSLTDSAYTFSVSGNMTLAIGTNVLISGSMAFSKGQTVTATLSDGSTKSVSVVTLGASSVNIFIGANGPYDSSNPNPNTIGISVPGGTFGLALLTPTDARDASRYYGVQGSVASASPVGVPDIALTLTSMKFRANGGTDATVANRVVDFS